MSRSNDPGPAGRLTPDPPPSRRRVLSVEGARRLGALVTLTVREAVRSRVLLGLTGLMCLFAAGSLLWPADLDAERVILVQRFCYAAMTFFGLIAAAFLGGASLPKDITTKRVYSLASKPVSRFELLLGKTLGVMGIMLIFLALGGVITFVVTHIASARRTYAGGSYTLEVTSPSAEIRTGDRAAQVRQGQVLVATGKTGNSYEARISRRHEEVAGTIPAADVQLHERSLQLRRVVKPTKSSTRSKGGAMFAQNELLLQGWGLAVGDTWVFNLDAVDLARQGRDVAVKLQFVHLRHEPRRTKKQKPDEPHVEIVFRNPATDQKIRKELDFTLQPNDRYEEVFALPAGLLGGGGLEARIVDYTPKYPAGGSVFFIAGQSPTWRIKGFNPNALPDGTQTIQARFLVHSRKGQDLVDHTAVTVAIRNPVTGQSRTFELHLRDKTTSYLHFPRELIHDREGVELTLSGLSQLVRIGHRSRETPVYLLLAPGSFWASTARSVFLIFLQLSLFAVLAVAASTFLSAPVAILLTLVIALSGTVKDLILETRTAAELGGPLRAALEGATLQDQAWMWVEHVLTRLLLLLAPGLTVFSSTDFVNRGWAVPWPAIANATLYAAVYMTVCFCLGYLMFRTREFE